MAESSSRSKMEGEQYEKFQEEANSLARSDIAPEIEAEREEFRRKIAKKQIQAISSTDWESINRKQLFAKKRKNPKNFQTGKQPE